MDKEYPGEAPENESMPDWAEPNTPMPVYEYAHLTDPDNEWLPATDWSKDGIIANQDYQ